MKYWILYIVLFICFACSRTNQNYEGYSLSENGFYYKLHSFKEGYNKAQYTDFVEATIQISAISNDSLSFTQDIVTQIIKQDSLNLSTLFLNCRQGDSISFIVTNSEKFRNLLPTEFTDLFKDTKEIKIIAKIHSVVDEQTYYQKQKEYEIWCRNKEEFELQTLDTYISQSKYKFVKNSFGIYKYIIKKGNSKTPKLQDVVTISYQGSLLNGELINHFTKLEFKYGQEWQVIKGLEIAIGEMQEGERAIIVVPSKYAWGDTGTSDKSIQPFSTIMFDVELLSIN